MSTPGAVREQLLALLGPVVAQAGYDLEELAVSNAGRRSLIRLSVDGDNGIDLDAVAELSRRVSEVLDGEGEFAANAAFSGPYVLEVGSPGVDRPLTEPRHWRRAAGRLVTVEHTTGQKHTAEKHPVLHGRVVASTETTLTLEIDGHRHDYPMSELGPGHIQVEFHHPGEPSAGPSADEADELDRQADFSGDHEQED